MSSSWFRGYWVLPLWWTHWSVNNDGDWKGLVFFFTNANAQNRSSSSERNSPLNALCGLTENPVIQCDRMPLCFMPRKLPIDKLTCWKLWNLFECRESSISKSKYWIVFSHPKIPIHPSWQKRESVKTGQFLRKRFSLEIANSAIFPLIFSLAFRDLYAITEWNRFWHEMIRSRKPNDSHDW